MTEKQTFLVGFDRFIAFHWAEFALDLAAHSPLPTETQVKALKEYLSAFMTGNDAARKTANVLTRLWLNSYPELMEHRTQALGYYPEADVSDHLLLHWGMSLAVFPLFRDVTIQMGRLFSIQGYFHRKDIHNRLMEKYGNLSTLPRSIDRIIQTLQDWKAIQQQKQGQFQHQSYQCKNQNLEHWLISTTIYATPQKRIALSDLYRMPELFAFELNDDVRLKLSTSTRIERDGNNLEYLVSK